MDYEQLAAFAAQQARSAGQVMRDYFGRIDKGAQTKHDKSPVTEADIAINKQLIEAVAAAYPEHGVQGEELSLHAEREQRWICDPIDGTEAFILGVPTAMFSLAYVEAGQPKVAALYDPFQDHLFTAVAGRGAFIMDGERLQVSRAAQLDGAWIGNGGTVALRERPLHDALFAAGAKLKAVPGTVYKGALVARGLIDGFIQPGNAHDFAALHLIVQEAGGKVTGLGGEQLDYNAFGRGAIVSNGALHDQLTACMHTIDIDELVTRK